MIDSSLTKRFAVRCVHFARGMRTSMAAAFGALALVLGTTSAAQTALEDQFKALIAEKNSRSEAEQKIDSQLLLLMYPQKFEKLPDLQNRLPTDGGLIAVDLQTVPEADVLLISSLMRLLSGPLYSVRVLTPSPTLAVINGVIRVEAQLTQLIALATIPQVRFIAPAYPALHNKASTSQGDKTHQAEAARSQSGKNGAGQKVCVISDGIDSLEARQATGDLPPGVQWLTGQRGFGDEGTAMLEIVYDLAPGATLGFATSNGGEAQFAQNILDLANPAKGGCHIIVDDTDYVTESPFQDGAVATAVNTVTAAGVLYFASAGNSGNLESLWSGTWEGDFRSPGGFLLPANNGYLMHEWQPGVTQNAGTSGSKRAFMHWVEPAGKSSIDYDLYVLDSMGKNIVAFSTNTQNGTQNPFEYTEAASQFESGSKLVVAKPIGKEDRMFNLQWWRGTLTHGTTGATRGHSAAAGAISVGATPAANSYAVVPNGPFPNPFGTAAKVEIFSSDGPRRIFYDVKGNLLTCAPAGNFKSTGGVVRHKPDIAAADGVSTNTPDFETFYGTSAAAPHAAAIAALVRQANPGMTAGQLRGKLLSSAIPISNNAVTRGAGVVMASLALQPLAASGTLDVDANGKYDALTDGILILRWLFGITGPSLTCGTATATAQRADPGEIKAYLDARRTSLDIDNNGSTDALTDGLLIMRYMFGLRGGTLVAGAVTSGAPRNTGLAIEDYIATLMPPTP